MARRTVLVSIAELAKQVRLGAENVLVKGVGLAADGLALGRNSHWAPLGASRRPCEAVQQSELELRVQVLASRHFLHENGDFSTRLVHLGARRRVKRRLRLHPVLRGVLLPSEFQLPRTLILELVLRNLFVMAQKFAARLLVVVSVHVALGILLNVNAVDGRKLNRALAVQVCAPQLRVETDELAPFKLLVFLPRAGLESAVKASAGL